MPELPSPILRALQGLEENSGRTLAIAGPPVSGKSALLEDLATQLKARKARVIQLKGSYRGRTVPYGALDGLRAGNGNGLGNSSSGNSSESSADLDLAVTPVPAVPYLSDRLPRTRRSRAQRPHTTFLGEPVRGRAANEGDPDAFWREILPEFRGPAAHPVAILIDDGALFDTESREFIVSLSRRARFRPFLIALALDSSVPGFVAWEEAFLGRGEVDWVRFSKGLPDPREAHRLKAVYDDLPSLSQRVAGYVSLMGGTVGEVVLSRVARLTFPQLAEALLPATGVGLVKVADGKVTMPHPAWVPLMEDLIPEKQRREMHLEIANALAALSPEPSLVRRTEVARHYLAWYPGPMALRYLLEAAEISLELLAFDTAEGLFAEAISCLSALPPAERDAVEPELRFLHARSLFSSGRLTEAEKEVRQGLDDALRAKVSPEVVTEWVEPLLLTMRAVGPRPSLSTTLVDLVERCHTAEFVETEVLFEALVAEFHYERNQPENARSESLRAAVLARKLPGEHLQALALLAVGLSHIEGNPEEQVLAERFLRSARLLLSRSRRWELDALAEDLEARLLETRGEMQRAREVRERSLPALQRAKLASLELFQQLGIAEILLNRENPKNPEPALSRAGQLTEVLHLVPPSVALLRCWLLEGRSYAIANQPEPARDRWEAVAEEPAADSIPRLKAEALVRLALLEYASGSSDRAAEWVEQLKAPEVHDALPAGWSDLLPDLARLAPDSYLGGGLLPPPRKLEGRGEADRGERARREPVGDRHSADDRQGDHENPVEEPRG